MGRRSDEWYRGAMPPDFLSHNPFAVLSVIAAPAILTNAASVLAMSTTNRFLRASERMHTLAAEMERVDLASDRGALLSRQVGRLESQAVLMLGALRAAYVALASFVSASFISILGGGLAASPAAHWASPLVLIALLAGLVGAGGLVSACTHLFRATRLSVLNISEEAALIRTRGTQRGG